jgi:hypothetical protein
MQVDSKGFWQKCETLGIFEQCSLSGIKKTREHNVSEIGAVSILRQEGGDTYSVGFIRKS